MEIYSTEEQQEEAIKKAIKENWKVVVFGACIGLGAVFGWRQYDAYQIEYRSEQSSAYAAIVEKIGQDEGELAQSVKDYIDKYDNPSYGVLLAFYAAKDAVENQQYDKAIEQLIFAAENAQNDNIKAISLIRLARISIQLQQYDQALGYLNTELPESYKAQISELKGDVYYAQNQLDEARMAYQAAADEDGLTGNRGLQYKLDNLTIATPDEY